MNLHNCVYRFLNKNREILYIGKSKDLLQRLSKHNHLPKECYSEVNTIEFCMYNTKDDMDLAEKYFISKIKPKYNKTCINSVITSNVQHLDNMEWYKFGSESFIDFQMEHINLLKNIKMIDNHFNLSYQEKLEKKLDLLKENIKIQEILRANICNELVLKQERYTNTEEYKKNKKEYDFLNCHVSLKEAGWYSWHKNKYVYVEHINETIPIQELNELKQRWHYLFEKENTLNKIYENFKSHLTGKSESKIQKST